jgi:hypothetical protein
MKVVSVNDAHSTEKPLIHASHAMSAPAGKGTKGDELLSSSGTQMRSRLGPNDWQQKEPVP